jgi:hypothetical protein
MKLTPRHLALLARAEARNGRLLMIQVRAKGQAAALIKAGYLEAIDDEAVIGRGVVPPALVITEAGRRALIKDNTA